MSRSARESLMAQIKEALGNRRLSAEECAALNERMRAPPSWPMPRLDDDQFSQFIAKARANLFSVERIASLQMLVPAVRTMLIGEAAPDISVAPALRHLGWPTEWKVNFGAGRMVEPMSITLAVAGIAETGSVVLRSDEENPTTLNFLPDKHVVVLRVSDIVAHPEDAWPRMRTRDGDWPRSVNTISGPSRTADVGGILVRPAHGPRSVHLVLVNG